MNLAGLLAWLLLNTFPWRLDDHSGMKIQQVSARPAERRSDGVNS